MKNIEYILGILLLLFSCQTNHIPGNETVKIELKNEETVSLIADGIFESVKYVPLQTEENVLIADIKKVKIVNDKIYLFDNKQESIFIFDRDGRFLRKFQKKGRGSGEYFELMDFEVDDKYLYIAARVPGGVLRYDLESFRFIDIIGRDLMPYRIICNSQSLLMYMANASSKEMKDIYIFDKHSGKETGRYKDLNENRIHWTSSASYLAEHNGKMYGFFHADYTVYQFTSDDYVPILSLDFGKDNMMPKEAIEFSDEEYDAYIENLPAPFERPIRSINNLAVTDSHIYFSFVYLMRPNFAIYSLKDKSIRFGSIEGGDKMPLIGALLCVTPDDEVVMYSEAYSLVSSLESLAKYNDEFIIPDELRNVSPEDNPILIIYKLKQ
jgi:hypothetical protein